MTPTINGISFLNYGANLLSYNVGAVDFSNGYVFAPKAVVPTKLPGSVGMRQIKLKLDFDCNTEDAKDPAQKISSMTALFMNGAVVALPDGYLYTCYFKTNSAPSEVAPWILQTTFTLDGYRHGAERAVDIVGTASISLTSNMETPIVAEITPTAGRAAVIFTINSVSTTIRLCTDVVIIDSLNKTVKMAGINKFGDTDLTEFPKLRPGANSISITGGTAVVRFTPLWL